METVVVTGYRASLEKAMDIKRTAVDASDSILAEDIGKFPDMNVSESLQRIPGVAIAREGGEGRQVTVRGLSAQFTRVRINNMEVLATTSGSDATGGTNRGRAFDFNIFASELFSQLTVHKSMSADLEEGSLGATVDLHTAHPFDHSGFVFTTSVQAGYSDMAGSTNPRIAALVSNTFLGGHLGVLFSGAYSSNRTLVDGSSTVRWADGSGGGQFGSVNGATSGDTYTLANSAYHPRFPRYDTLAVNEKRLGLTGSVQWQADDDTVFTLDGMFADFSQLRDASSFEANSFSLTGAGASYNYVDTNTNAATVVTTLATNSINLINFVPSQIDSTNSLTSAQFTNVGLRSERSDNHLDTRFMQLTLDGTHSFSERLKAHMTAGWSESHFRNPLSINLTADDGCIGTSKCYTGGAGTNAQPYSYDYTKGYLPSISYGNVDVTSSNGWFLSQASISQNYNYNSFRTAVADVEYSPVTGIKLQSGIDYRNFGYNTIGLSRSNGSTSSLGSSIPAAMRSTPLSTYSNLISLRGVTTPSGTPTTWWAPDINKAIDLFGLNDQKAFSTTGVGACASGCGAFYMGAEPNASKNGAVHESDYGAWAQVSWDTFFYGVPFRGDAGGRYVLTETTSTGFIYNAATKNSDATVVSQTYHDFLPSVNAVLEPADNFLMRLNASYAVARPDLTNMLPGGSVSGSQTTRSVSITNPLLKPTRSKNIDLSFEWYYHKGALLSIAMFYKHIDSTVQKISTQMTYHGNPYGLSDDLAIASCGASYGPTCNEYSLWNFSMPVNKPGGPLYGTEINWQQPFDFLPSVFGDMGFLGNVTLVQAQQNYYNADGTIRLKDDLEGLSRTSYNATLYYDDQTFQARITTAFRSKYALTTAVSNGNNGNYMRSALNVDMSASYKIDENFMVTFDGMNLTNQPMNIYTDKYAKRLYEYKETGRVYYVGVKYTY